jgi:hypothetical protein
VKLENMTHGRRVRIARDIDVFNLGSFKAGETGTVNRIGEDTDEFPCTVKLDTHHRWLNEWDNELQVWRFDDGEVTADLFEPVEG